MAKLTLDITVSLDGFVAGPNQTLEEPLGEGGEQLHEWVFASKPGARRHGQSGGEANADSEVVEESVTSTGATIMGRRMFSGGAGPWEDDPNADAWWGDEPPFHPPVFILTHHAREPVPRRAERRSRSSPTDSSPPSSRPERPPATRTSRSRAARASCSSTSRPGLLDELQHPPRARPARRRRRLFDHLGTRRSTWSARG